jgi:hypothetical protein
VVARDAHTVLILPTDLSGVSGSHLRKMARGE